MNKLYYELFSGVGFFNQLFSLETAIYMANRMDRELHLIIRNPLVYCGKADWNYGIITDYLDTNCFDLLNNDIIIYVNDECNTVNDVIHNNNITYTIDIEERLSNCVIVDENLHNDDNMNDILNFCHHRKKYILDWESLKKHKNIYFNKSNASRCFYNFYTNKDEYKIMNNICSNLKFKKIIYDIVENKITNLNNYNNRNFIIGLHLRFGDYYKDKQFIERWNETILNNIIYFIKGHITNLFYPKIIITCDRKDNIRFFESLYKDINKDKIIFIEDIFKDINIFFENQKLNEKIKIKKYCILNSIVYNIFNSKLDEFIGTSTSTYSVYTQYLRYLHNKSYNFYSNLNCDKFEQCRLVDVRKDSYDWINKNYKGGHPVSWTMFWKIPKLKKNTQKVCVYYKIDGFGSQFQAQLSLLAYTYFKNDLYEFVFYPFYKMDHNDNNLKEYPSIMADFTNFKNHFEIYHTCVNKHLIDYYCEGPVVHGSKNPSFFYTKNILSYIRNCFINSNYYLEKIDTINKFKKDTLNIAVHIRRGDVSSSKNKSRYTTNEDYINIINILLKNINNYLKEFNKNSYNITIYSEGKEEDFISFNEIYSNIKFKLNYDIRDTFIELIESDILILSKSSYSYCAGLLNPNIVICNTIQNWWHHPLENWKIIK